MPIEILRSEFTSPKRATAQGTRALGQAAGQLTQSIVDNYKTARATEGFKERLVGEVAHNFVELGDWKEAGFDSAEHAKDWVKRLQDMVLQEGVSTDQAEKMVLDAMNDQKKRASQAKTQKQAAGITGDP